MTDNTIVLYAPNTGLDISRCMIELQTTLSRLTLETRIIVDGHMFAGGFRGLEFDPYGVEGVAYIRLFEEVKEEPKTEPSFSDKVLRKVFGEKVPRSDIEHEGKKYNKQWGVTTSKYYDNYNQKEQTRRILWYNRYEKRLDLQEELLGQLKINVAQQTNTLVSNDLLSKLFDPLIPPLAKVFYEVARF